MKIARNDIVEVISGDHKGSKGRVLKVDRAKNRVTVSWPASSPPLSRLSRTC